MPFPTLGPTTLFHLLVILVGLFVRLLVPQKWRWWAFPAVQARPILCSSIIVSVSVGVLAGASALVYFTATEQNSTVNVVAAYFDDSNASLQVMIRTSSTPAARLATLPECGGVYQGGSLFEFLAEKGRDDSLQARKQLAFDFGIAGYEGLESQNRQLLSLLLKADCHNEPY